MFRQMRHQLKIHRGVRDFAVLLMLLALSTVGFVQAQTYKVLHSFAGSPDGQYPHAGLVRDSAGNFYGTTASGGLGFGTVFKLNSKGGGLVLHNFAGPPNDGSAVGRSGLVRDSKGNLYGTTVGGGTYDYGTVFKVTPAGNETVLYSFTSGADGGFPYAGVIRDASGNLYGTTIIGSGTGCGGTGCGTVFRLDSNGIETVLYNFSGGDGDYPAAPLGRDSAGNLYGTTVNGGDFSCDPQLGCGVAFILSPEGKETVLHSFLGGMQDGAYPYSSLIRDEQGNFYGTTSGGAGVGCGGAGCGTIFKLDKNGNETILHAFTGGVDGSFPAVGLIRDRNGNFYGTTEGSTGTGCGGYGCGTVFKLDPFGNLTTLYAFIGRKDGGQPRAVVALDPAGNLYGTTFYGGNPVCPPLGCGVAFKIVP